MYTVDSIIVFIVLSFVLIWPIIAYYNPKIDIVKQDSSYVVFLLYNKWKNNKLTRGRKYLFIINK